MHIYPKFLLVIVVLVAAVGLFATQGDILTGAVVREDAMYTLEESNVWKCEDSDGGEKIYRYGIASDGKSAKYDYCTNKAGETELTVLKEAICLNNLATYVTRNCEKGCYDGACMR